MVKAVTDTLFDYTDEELQVFFADLLPVVHKINDAAANYITKASKKLNEPTEIITSGQYETLTDSLREANNIVKMATHMERMIQNPNKYLQTKLTAKKAAESVEVTVEEV